LTNVPSLCYDHRMFGGRQASEPPAHGIQACGPPVAMTLTAALSALPMSPSERVAGTSAFNQWSSLRRELRGETLGLMIGVAR